jgi:hypothetical protein
MKNLANIQSAVADMLARVELERAGIPAYQAVPTGDDNVKSNVVGFLEFDGGTDVLFVRCAKHWTARISGSRQQTSTSTTVKLVNEKYVTPINSRQVDYVCESLKALTTFQNDLEEKFQYFRDREDGCYEDGTRSEPCDLLPTFGFAADGLSLLTPPRGDSQLILMEIRALKAYGRELNNIFDTIRCDEEALDVAVSWLGWRNPECTRLASQLSKLLKEEITRTQQLLDQLGPGHNDRVKLMSRLEWFLMRKLPLVTSLHRSKDIAATERKLEVLRVDLISTCRHAAESFRISADDVLARYPAGALRERELNVNAYIAAFNFGLLHDLCLRIGTKHAARTYGQLRDYYRSHLSEENRTRVDDAVKNVVR